MATNATLFKEMTQIGEVMRELERYLPPGKDGLPLVQPKLRFSGLKISLATNASVSWFNSEKAGITDFSKEWTKGWAYKLLTHIERDGNLRGELLSRRFLCKVCVTQFVKPNTQKAPLLWITFPSHDFVVHFLVLILS